MEKSQIEIEQARVNKARCLSERIDQLEATKKLLIATKNTMPYYINKVPIKSKQALFLLNYARIASIEVEISELRAQLEAI